jgi:uncharacterized membrane protein
MILGIVKKKWWLFTIGLILSIAQKEDVTVTIGALGLVLLLVTYLRSKQINKYSLAMIGGAILSAGTSLVLATVMVHNRLSLMSDVYYYQFAYLKLPILQAIPQWAKYFFSIDSVWLILAFLGPLLFLPLLSLKWSIPALVILLVVMSSNFWGQHTMLLQYPGAATAYLFVALIVVIAAHPKIRNNMAVLIIPMVFISILVTFSPLTRVKDIEVPNVRTHSIDATLAEIPNGVSVTATNEIFDHLVTRCNTYLPYNGFDKAGPDFGFPCTVTDYVVISKWRPQADWDETVRPLLSIRYNLVSDINGTQLWKLKGESND